MLAKAVATLPRGREWSYEVKWDGYRMLAVKDGAKVRLLSRTQTDLTRHFPQIAADVSRLPVNRVVLDGEVVALDTEGRPSFRRLQEHYRRIREHPPLALAYYAFDLLELDGRSWMPRPLTARRQRLVELVVGDTLLRSDPLPGRVADIERRIREFGLEGIVAKRRRSRYQPGTRSRDWVKVRFSPRQEFVVGGYIPRDSMFDALLVGYYVEGELRYAGQVRSGFSKHERAAVALRLASSKSVACPFADLPHHLPYRRRHPWDQRITPADMPRMRWVPPSVVIETSFLGWERHGLLRDATFFGVRADKAAHTVTRELDLL